METDTTIQSKENQNQKIDGFLDKLGDDYEIHCRCGRTIYQKAGIKAHNNMTLVHSCKCGNTLVITIFKAEND
jgi:hypothetical protein